MGVTLHNEMQIKTTVKYHFIPTGIIMDYHYQTPEKMQNDQNSDIAKWNVKWYGHLENHPYNPI